MPNYIYIYIYIYILVCKHFVNNTFKQAWAVFAHRNT